MQQLSTNLPRDCTVKCQVYLVQVSENTRDRRERLCSWDTSVEHGSQNTHHKRPATVIISQHYRVGHKKPSPYMSANYVFQE